MHLRIVTSGLFACSRPATKHGLLILSAHTSQLLFRRCNHHGAHALVLDKLRSRHARSKIFDNVLIVDTLRECYPEHSLTQTRASTGLLKLAQAGQLDAKLDKSIGYYASRDKNPQYQKSAQAGLLWDRVEFGRYDCRWGGHQFYIYVCDYSISEYDSIDNHYIMFPNQESSRNHIPSATVDELLLAALKHDEKVSEEIWVYDQGYWSKNHQVWQSVAKNSFDQIVLNEALKRELMEDVMTFFDQKQYYASFGVPWKRGVIFHGLPGNGKTLSIKALMQALSTRPVPIPTLYVKSFGRRAGQDDIRAIFSKARETSPCLLVLEDLDSLVSDENRSFFLNEIDGIEQNDGIMIIGSTNHLDKLDVGISKRPSRFDRKYHFPLPGSEERTSYCDVWRSKLAKNTQLDFPIELSAKISSISEGLSFAYLQEIFIASMTSLIRANEDEQAQNLAIASAAVSDLSKNRIWLAVSAQIAKIRKEMLDSRKSIQDNDKNSVLSDASSGPVKAAGFGR